VKTATAWREIPTPRSNCSTTTAHTRPRPADGG
jgi:hypothetical protein